MIQMPSVQVEVTVQDHFFAPAASPITEQTWQDWFQNWLTALKSDLPAAASYELSLRLTTDAEIQLLNADYRQKHLPTDVLAFAALEINYPQISEMVDQPVYLGDIVISIETAQRQAAERHHSLSHELAWLSAHALLHLLGWDHPDEQSLLAMLEQQEFLLRTIGLELLYD